MRFSARRHERRRLLTRSDRASTTLASSHEIGQSLDDLSVQELDERITTLQAEITRLEEARRAKQTSLSAAAAFFKFETHFRGRATAFYVA